MSKSDHRRLEKVAERELPPVGSVLANGVIFDPFSNDLHAIEDWLQSKQLGSKHSIRAYKSAAFFLRQWLMQRHASSVDDLMIRMTSAEANAFVADLFKRSKLKAVSIRHKVVLLNGLYDFWATARDGGKSIVLSNPFHGISKSIKSEKSSNMGSQRAFGEAEVAQIRYVIESLKGGAHDQHYHRTLLIWLLAVRMALRREEIANLRASDFSVSSEKRRWILRIQGKGRQLSDEYDVVVVPDEVIACIRAYRAEIGLFPDPTPSDSGPLLRRLSDRSETRARLFLSPEHVARIIKALFRMAAKDAEIRLQNTGMSQRLLMASTHWGRHTWFVTALKKHPIHLVSLGGRHRDIRTTQNSYVSLSEDDLAKLAD